MPYLEGKLSLFISFEGGEGSGKTTQTKRLKKTLSEKTSCEIVALREPGSTPLGDYLREWLKNETQSSLPNITELLLFAAARSILVENVINPSLEKPNTIVITDRYLDSTTAYQGYGRQLPLKDLRNINDLSTQGLVPALTFLLDCTPEESLTRIDSLMNHENPKNPSRIDKKGTRRFEEESIEFHERVRNGYLATAKSNPNRWIIINATLSEDDIASMIWVHVKNKLECFGIK